MPVPINTDDIVEAIFEGLLLRERSGGATELYLPGLEEYIKPKKDELYEAWESAAAREKRSRTMFAQESIKVDEVAQELAAAKEAVGRNLDVADFVHSALTANQAIISGEDPATIDLREVPRSLRDLLELASDEIKVTYSMPVQEGEQYLTRTHPFVENLASYVMDTALEGMENGVAKRCGAIRTRAVELRTTLLLIRLRYHLVINRHGEEHPLLAEEVRALGFTGAPQEAEWLDAAAAEHLLTAKPDENIHPEQAARFIQAVIDGFDHLQPHLEGTALDRAETLLEAHRRVRDAAKAHGRYAVEPKLPVDMLGIYIYLPVI